MISKLLYYLWNLQLILIIINCQNDYSASLDFHYVTQISFNPGKNPIPIQKNYSQLGVLLGIMGADIYSINPQMYFKPVIENNQSIKLEYGSTTFVSISYFVLLIDLSRFKNIAISNILVEISKCNDTNNIVNGKKQYLCKIQFDEKYKQAKKKKPLVFLTGYKTQNDLQNKFGVSISFFLMDPIGDSEFQLTIEIRQNCVDMVEVYFSYLVEIIDEQNPSRHYIQSFDLSQEFPCNVNQQYCYNDGTWKGVQHTLTFDPQIYSIIKDLKDFKNYLFIGENKIDYEMPIVQPRDPYNIRYSATSNIFSNENKFQVTVLKWENSKPLGFRTTLFYIIYKQCPQNQIFDKDKCFEQCPSGTYKKYKRIL